MGHVKHKSVLVTAILLFQIFVSINSQGKNLIFWKLAVKTHTTKIQQNIHGILFAKLF